MTKIANKGNYVNNLLADITKEYKNIIKTV